MSKLLGKKIPLCVLIFTISMFSSLLFGKEKDNSVFSKRVDLVYSAEKMGLAKLLNSDPIDVDQKYLTSLNVYRAFVGDGERLKNYCYYKPAIYYNKDWDRVQTKRVLLTSLQFAGLRVAMKAITAYTKELSFSEGEFRSMVDKLVGGGCSKNITFISSAELKRYFLERYSDSDENFELPSVEGNPLFPSSVHGLDTRENILRREFLYTTKLFRSFCSWGNDVDNLRLLVPLVKNPIIMSWLIRTINNQVIDWDSENEIAVAARLKSDVHFSCRQYLCRKSSEHIFKKTLPAPIGESSIRNNFERLYCSDFLDSEFTYVEQSPQVREWINEQSFEEHRLLASQFIALITKVPDFIIWSQTFESAKQVLKSGMDGYIDNWVKSQSARFSDDIFYEEPLLLERVKDVLYSDDYDNSLKVIYDVNLGEFDKNTSKLGKIKLRFNIKVQHDYLVEFRAKWRETNKDDKKERKHYLNEFSKHIEDSIDKTRDKFKLPIWNRGLVRIAVNALIDHLIISKGDYFTSRKRGFDDLEIELRYGPFALKYLYYKYRTGSKITEQKD